MKAGSVPSSTRGTPFVVRPDWLWLGPSPFEVLPFPTLGVGNLDLRGPQLSLAQGQGEIPAHVLQLQSCPVATELPAHGPQMATDIALVPAGGLGHEGHWACHVLALK